MRPSPGYRLRGSGSGCILSGTKLNSLLLPLQPSTIAWVLSSPTLSVCCPSGSFTGLAQLVSKPPLITHQLPISTN